MDIGATPSIAPPNTPPRILIVDPAETEQLRLADAFRERGLPALTVADAQAAADLVDAAPSGHFLLVLLDPVAANPAAEDGTGESPGLDRFLEMTRRGPRVVVRSAFRDGGSVVRCLNGGATDFIDKAAPDDELFQTVRAVLERPASADDADDAGGVHAEQPLQGWIELTAASELDHLRRMQRFSDALFTRRLPPELCEDLRIIIEETGRNAIEWGNRFDKNKHVTISYCLLPDRIVLKFEDEGEGFRPREVPDPTVDPVAHLKHREEAGKRPGGYGVFLVQQVMDEVVYSEKGNVVVMTKLIPGE